MPRRLVTGSPDLRVIFQKAMEMKRVTAKQTPLLAIIVSLFLDKIGFVEYIDEMIKWDKKQWRVSPGILAKSIVLVPFIYPGPRLPICGISEYYQPIDMGLLFPPDIKPEYFTRDAISCLLDRFFAAGCERIYTTLAFRAYSAFSIPFSPVVHGDTTTVSLYGTYEGEEDDEEDSSTPRICKGYSKDGKKGLVQVTLGLVCDRFGIPLVTTVRDGNQADCTWNTAIIQTLSDLNPFKNKDVTYIADAKLATIPNIQMMISKGFQFVTRCPANFGNKVAKEVTEAAYRANEWIYIGSYRESNKKEDLATYDVQEFTRSIDGVLCRLFVFRSSALRKNFEKQISEKRTACESFIQDTIKKRFACEEDARRVVISIKKLLKNQLWTCDFVIESIITEKRSPGRPGKNAKPPLVVTEWAIKASDLITNEVVYQAELWKAESFVLITNAIALMAPAKDILQKYKGQKTVEDNFSVIKRPMMVDSIFLKKPRRIVALVTLLAFALLIQVVIRVLVRRNLDAMETPPGLDHGCKPLVRPGLKKILRFIGYHFIITQNGERKFWCISYDHEKNLAIWLQLLEIGRLM